MMFLSLGSVMMLLTQLLAMFFPSAFAVDADCNYYQQMVVGQSYYVYNKEYPGYYGPSKTCRWVGIAPANSKITINCNVEMPQSTGCSADRLLISTTGNPNLVNAHSYCGFGNLTLVSDYNNITVGLVTAQNTKGGRFLCTMSANSIVPPQCDCGWKNTRRIVGGVETKVNEYPMMAGLVDFISRDLYCGATIIAKNYALTAAHCLYNKQATAVGLLIGEHDTSIGSETSATKLLLISRLQMHPYYQQTDPKALNDIGVVTTATPIDFNAQVGPVCLPFRYYQETFAGYSTELLGWGTTEFTGPKSNVLLKTDVRVLTTADCAGRAGGTVNQMCTFKTGHDACQADSGGPVLYLDNNTYREILVGVISTGLGCASAKPALNTRVTSYLSWIASVTPGADYCIK